MKPKITEEQLNQEFKRLGFINGTAYKIIGRKYNISAHGVEVKASKMRRAGKLINLEGAKSMEELSKEELVKLFSTRKENEDNIKNAIKQGHTREQAEYLLCRWKGYFKANSKEIIDLEDKLKTESHIKELQTQPKEEIKPTESNSSSQNKSALESTNNTQKAEPILNLSQEELIDKYIEKRIPDEPQTSKVQPYLEKKTTNIPKITTLKPITMEGQNSIYMFNKCGVQVNTLGNTTITPELLQEQQEALELWNLHYKKLG